MDVIIRLAGDQFITGVDPDEEDFRVDRIQGRVRVAR